METEDPPPIEVTFFQRRPYGGGHFSLEFIFRDVRNRLDHAIRSVVVVAPWESKGVVRRLAICFEAFRRQGQINHVTGDINYVGLVLNPKRTIQTIHDLGSIERTRGIRRAILKLLWVTIPVKRAAAVTVVSEATKMALLRHVPSCSTAKLFVIPVAISQRFRRKDKPFNPGRPRILQIGTAENKNIPRLVQALRGLSCTLEVVGVYRQECETLLRESGIDYVYRTGLSEVEMVDCYERADIVAFASTYEGFGMPILEAQAVGRPVISSNLLSMPDVAGRGACLVDPYNVSEIRRGLEQVIHDDVYRGSLVEAGFENVKRFDPKAIARQYLELYQKIAASGT